VSKIIKLTDEVYLLLRNEANSGGRTIAGQVKYMLSSEKNSVPQAEEWDEVKGVYKPQMLPCCRLKKPCKHWVWDMGQACWVNTLTGDMKGEDE